MPSDDSNQAPDSTLPAPSRSTVLAFGEYDVLGELGEGGMGRVYKAVDRALGRVVAVKVLRSTDPFECSRFRGEAELIAGLEHPNIVRIFAVDTAPDGRPYIVLEYAEGGSLDRELGGRPQEPRRAAEMTEALARAVQYAHEKGVIHRDLKPANVLRGKDKALKLTDFGLAKELEVSSGMTPSGAVMGTPSYMAPEQAEGKVKQLGPTADVYGLGAILYEMLTGRPPFRGVNVVDTLEQVRWAEPAPPSRLAPRLPRDLSTICLKCLQKAPARRYQTAAALADDLRRWLNGETIAARPAPSWERLLRQIRRRPWEAATVTACALLAALLLAGWVFAERRAAEEQVRDEKAAADQQVRSEREEADRKLREEQEGRAHEQAAAHRASEAALRSQARQSLDALNEIRALVLDGDLSRHPGLDPLYTALSEYYDKLLARDDLRFDKVDLADGLVKVGDLFVRTGDKKRAREAYQKAADRCRPLADPKARSVLAAALLKGGQVAFDLKDYPATEAAVTELGARLAALAPPPTGPIADPLAASQIAEAHHLRGQLLARRNEPLEAERYFKRSLELRERLAGAFPADLPAGGSERKHALAALADVGRGYGYLGDALLDANKLPEAETAYWWSHEIRKRVSGAYPAADNSGEALDAKLQLARSWNNFAGLYTRQRALGAARYFADQSLAVYTELTKRDPINTEYKLDVCGRLVQIAELDIQMWVRPGVALAPRQRAEIAANLERARALVSEDPAAKDKRARRELAATAQILNGILLADVDRDRARNELMDAFKLLNPLVEAKDVPPDPVHLYYRAVGRIMFLELSSAPSSDATVRERIEHLRVAVAESGARQRHPDDVEQFRAFQVVKDHPDFKKLVDALRAKAAAKPAAPSP